MGSPSRSVDIRLENQRVNLREQRKAARSRVAALKAEARVRVAKLPVVKNARRRRWVRRALTALILLLLLLFIRCDCGPSAIEPVDVVHVAVDAGIKPITRKKPFKPHRDTVGSNPRRGWATGTALGPAWLDEFRIQVAARSPRLAQCFTGTGRPGALRWSVALNPESGAVSDHELEPLGAADLSALQQQCLQKTLSTPPYRISPKDRLSVPPRVTLTIEF